MFLYGLNPLLTPLVATAANINTLDAAITRARTVETGYNYVPSKDITLKVTSAVENNPIESPKLTTTEAKSDVDALT
jgi:hypothetical protein